MKVGMKGGPRYNNQPFSELRYDSVMAESSPGPAWRIRKPVNVKAGRAAWFEGAACAPPTVQLRN